MNFDLQEARSLAAKRRFVQGNYRRPKALTFAYLRFRLMRPLLKWYYKRYLRQVPNRPWLAPAAIEILDRSLQKTDKVLEYGSGRSSLWLAERCGELHAVEHYAEWAEKVKGLFAEAGAENARLHQIAEGSPVAPAAMREMEGQLSELQVTPRWSMAAYMHHVLTYPDQYFDLVIIDGRARVETAKLSLEKLKPGGLLLLDDAGRNQYREVHQWLAHWPQVFTTTGLNDSVIWHKPEPA